MANYQQAQPFSFTGMPSTYTGGFNANPSTYTGGFTPYQRLVTPQPALPVGGTTSATTGGGGGDGYANSPEGRAEREARMDKLRAELGEEGYAKRNDWIGKVLPAVLPLGWLPEAANKVQTFFKEQQLKDIYAKEAEKNEADRLKAESDNLLSMIKDTNEGTPYTPPQGDPAQRAQAEANAADAAAAAASAAAAAQAATQGDTSNYNNEGGRSGRGDGPNGPAGRGDPGGDRGGWGRGGGYAQGGHVSMMHLQGPNPAGPDDGYAALKDGEYVINNKAVNKYGIELMNAINSGKISKGKLRGLLEM